MIPSSIQLQQAVHHLAAGELIAYPTEAVYGLGCDPFQVESVVHLLECKQRPIHKGLILIAASRDQLAPLLKPLTATQEKRLRQTWPGPVTWTLPCDPAVPYWLRGDHDSLAVRVTAHPAARALCLAWGGPLVSTSANRSGGRPARTALRVRRQWGNELAYIVPGSLGRLAQPTQIRDGRNGMILRPSPGA